MIDIYVGDNASGKTFYLKKLFNQIRINNLKEDNSHGVVLGFDTNRNINVFQDESVNLDNYGNSITDFTGNRKWDTDPAYHIAITQWCLKYYPKEIQNYFKDFFGVDLNVEDEYLSDGNASFLVIISEIIFCKKKFNDSAQISILIDEVESYLHVKQQEKIIEFLIENFDVKIVVSTHSVIPISRLKKDVCICYLEKNSIESKLIINPAKKSIDFLKEKILKSPRFDVEIKKAIDLVAAIINDDYPDVSNVEDDIAFITSNIEFCDEFESCFIDALKILKIKKENNAQLRV